MSIVTGIPDKKFVDGATAIASLKPGAEFAYTPGVGVIAWHSPSITQPSQSEIDAEETRLKALWDTEQYKRNREREYPSYADQFDLIYHSGVDAWKTKIKEIKDKYPKP